MKHSGDFPESIANALVDFYEDLYRSRKEVDNNKEALFAEFPAFFCQVLTCTYQQMVGLLLFNAQPHDVPMDRIVTEEKIFS